LHACRDVACNVSTFLHCGYAFLGKRLCSLTSNSLAFLKKSFPENSHVPIP
jgi:hypothetical protein